MTFLDILFGIIDLAGALFIALSLVVSLTKEDGIDIQDGTHLSLTLALFVVMLFLFLQGFVQFGLVVAK